MQFCYHLKKKKISLGQHLLLIIYQMSFNRGIRSSNLGFLSWFLRASTAFLFSELALETRGAETERARGSFGLKRRS